MRRGKASLWILEGLAVLLFVGFAVLSIRQSDDGVAISPIDPKALEMEIGEIVAE